MAAVLKIAGKLYVVQAGTGFAVGFFVPWLKSFRAAAYEGHLNGASATHVR